MTIQETQIMNQFLGSDDVFGLGALGISAVLKSTTLPNTAVEDGLVACDVCGKRLKPRGSPINKATRS